MISHNTAKQMAEMGFPQPEYKEGQIWASDTHFQWVILFRYSDYVSYVKLAGEIVRERKINDPELPDWVYLPTVSDIMRELGPEYLFSIGTITQGEHHEDGFFVEKNDATKGYDKIAEEAAAKAWIEKHS